MIYAIQAGANGPIKFGKSENPKRRLAALQTGSHERLVLLASMTVHDGNEEWIHTHLNRDRISGEWFAPSDAALSMVEILKQSVDGYHRVVDYLYAVDPRVIGNWDKPDAQVSNQKQG